MSTAVGRSPQQNLKLGIIYQDIRNQVTNETVLQGTNSTASADIEAVNLL